MKGTVVSVTILLLVGATCCLLLYYRDGPFSPGSSVSLALGLDSSSASSTTSATPAPASASASTSASASSSAPVTSSTATNQTAQNPSASAATATPLAYLSISGADMPEQDMPVTGDDGKPASSQGTYGPAGCTAICNSNAGCAASIYSPSTKTCWIKSGLTPGKVSGNADRVLQIPDTGATGAPANNYNYPGNDTVSLPLPSADDCSTLCRALPWSACQGSTYDSNAKTCHIKAPASNLTPANNMVSWGKKYLSSYNSS